MKPKISYTEIKVDSHGVKRIYGYSADGQKFWLNLAACQEQYEAKGLKVLEAVR